MQLVILVAFVLVLSLRHGPDEAAGVVVLVPAAVAYVVLAGVLAGLNASRALRAMDGPPPPGRRRSRGLLSLLVPAYLLGGLAELLFMGWGRVLDATCPACRNVPLLPEAVALAPFVAALVLVWMVEYPLHRRVRRQLAARFADEGWTVPAWSRGEFLAFNFRNQFLFIAVPVAMIWLANDLILQRNWPAVLAAAQWVAARLNASPLGQTGQDALTIALSAAVSLTVFLFVPVLLVRVWRTSPLPPGELRDALLDTLRALRLRCRPLRVWHSGGVVANAGVMGLIAPLRYVLLSDALLDRMDRRQVQAVFAHEVGHIQQHHIFYSVLFTLSVIAWGSLLAEWAADLGLIRNEFVLNGVALVAMAAGWGFGFGFVSRRFERQSDVIAAWTVGLPCAGDPRRVTPEGATLFASALRRVAQLNGMSPTSFNWRHGTVESRVNFLLALAVTGGTRRPIDRQVRQIKRMIWLAVLVAAVAVTWTVLRSSP